MKKVGRGMFFSVLFLASFFILPTSTFAYTSPGKPVGFLNDFAHILSATDSATINAQLTNVNTSTGAQVTVVTIPSLGDETIETYAVKLFQEWGIGIKGKDNGLLIVIAPNDQEARIEVGYGLEGTVTDLQAGNIVRTVMIPAFKTGDYAGGIRSAVEAVGGLIANDPSVVTLYSTNNTVSSSNQSSGGGYLSFVFFFGIIILNILARILGRTKSWWLGGVLGAIVGVVVALIWGFIIGVVSIVVLTICGLIFDYIVSNHPPKSGGGGIWPIFFGGGGFGGSGGGGFGGFGGGSSGGGGASGRW